MKTQISNLLSGTKLQVLNPKKDYTIFPKATSHVGHAGSSYKECEPVWEKVKAENPEKLSIIFMGEKLTLKANWSLSKKSVNYFTTISEELFDKISSQKSKEVPSLTISFANSIEVSNGKNLIIHICPSLIEIVD